MLALLELGGGFGPGAQMTGGLAELRCNLADDRIDESSGVAGASWSDDVMFTHNDSGDGARFFAVDTRTCSTRATFTVKGAGSRDWEDMAAATAGDGTAVLWLADIGDNDARRPSIVVYEVAEPGLSDAGGPLPVRSRMELTYPDGAHDAEALLVDPETGRPVVVTKDRSDGRSRAYRAPAGGTGELVPLAALDVKALPGGSLASPAWAVTAGDTSADRRRVVLRSYLAVWVWSASPGEPLSVVLSRPPASVDAPLTRQPEAIAFTRDGRGLWVTTEGAGTPLHLVPLDPLEARPGQEAAPPAGREDPSGSGAAPEPVEAPAKRSRPVAVLVALAAGAAVAAGLAAALLTRPRR